MVVVLPAPFGPRRPKISPRRTSTDRSTTARTFRPQKPTRKVLERCSATTAVSIGAHVYRAAGGPARTELRGTGWVRTSRCMHTRAHDRKDANRPRERQI